jgi:predicted Rdx family selenoprotein
MMSYDMANSISKITTQAVIGAVNVNCSLPHILAFAGTKLWGLGLHHHYCVQGTNHCKQIIQHLRQQDENSKMYKMIFEYGQLSAGVQYPILQHPKPHLLHINDPMITTIHQFLAESQLNIVIPGLYSPQPLQENNHNIMGELMKIEKSPIAIQRVNQCRLFLQITWLSEMSNKLRMTPAQLPRVHWHPYRYLKKHLKWPIQELPLQKSWEIWKKWVCKQFLQSKLSRLGMATLETPLGAFIQTHDNHQVWNWEQTGTNTIVENTYLFNVHQQVHYRA